MLSRKLLTFIAVIATVLFAEGCNCNRKSFVLWQLPSQTGGQMNSYVIQTAGGKVVVIDGGYKGDAPYLKGFLAAIGNTVDMWFVSHQHIDHVEALTAILKNPGDLKIKKIYGSLQDQEWGRIYNGNECSMTIQDFDNALRMAHRQVTEVELGEVIKIDKMNIGILSIKNPEIIANGINNSSVVMRVWDIQKSILFTGDLGREGGQKLMNGPYCNCLKSDYVQMAHHGQNGVDEDFYKAVSPKYCIWPTPLWLWDNDCGKGKGSGPWKTEQVRGWMSKLNVKKNYILFEGLVKIQ